MDKKIILSKFYTYNKLSYDEKRELVDNMKKVWLWDVDFQQKAILICQGLNERQYNDAYIDYERRALNPQDVEDARIRSIFYILTGRREYRL